MKQPILLGIVLIALAACSSTKQNSSSVNTNQFDKQGHRGCRGLMPENTIPAMIKAIDLDVTTLEMDLGISKDKKVIVANSQYGGTIPVVVEKNNLFGTQFHPEKSGTNGAKIIKNFLAICGGKY